MKHLNFFEQQDKEAHAASEPITPWIVVLDRKQRIISSNEPSRSLVNLGPDELTGRPFGELTGLYHLSLLISKGCCFDSQLIRALGQKLVCNYEPIFETQKPAGGILTIARTTLEDYKCLPPEEIVDLILAKSDIEKDGIVMINREGFITMINQAFADAVGGRAQNIVGNHVMKSARSKLSRLPVVMQTGKAEVGVAHFINGRDVIVSRYPLLREGRMIGAFGKIHFKKPQQGVFPRKQKKSFRYDVESIIGESRAIQTVKDTLLQVANKGSNVLITGESGTGKELFAHALHAASNRRSGPFIKVNCAAIPEQLLESELFGYFEGAFTGAKKGGQIGKFELAHNGSIFLDEIGDMPLPMQAKLLRVLQEKEVAPLGSTVPRRIEIRVIAATNANLEKRVREGRFRTDLYYRLNIVTLNIPPLRQREGDIAFLVRHFLRVFNTEFGMHVRDLTPEARTVLESYDFPGNVRELRNIIERAFNIVNGPLIERKDLPKYISQTAFGGNMTSADYDFTLDMGIKTMPEIIEKVEKCLIEKALMQTKGNKPEAANLLGISRAGLYYKIQKYKLR